MKLGKVIAALGLCMVPALAVASAADAFTPQTYGYVCSFTFNPPNGNGTGGSLTVGLTSQASCGGGFVSLPATFCSTGANLNQNPYCDATALFTPAQIAAMAQNLEHATAAKQYVEINVSSCTASANTCAATSLTFYGK